MDTGWHEKVSVDVCDKFKVENVLRQARKNDLTPSSPVLLSWNTSHLKQRVRYQISMDIFGEMIISFTFPKSPLEAGPLRFDYDVILIKSSPHFGGHRYWFQCPMPTTSGEPCRNRSGVLYLPPGEKMLACRKCHDLKYVKMSIREKEFQQASREQLNMMFYYSEPDQGGSNGQ